MRYHLQEARDQWLYPWKLQVVLAWQSDTGCWHEALALGRL